MSCRREVVHGIARLFLSMAKVTVLFENPVDSDTSLKQCLVTCPKVNVMLRFVLKIDIFKGWCVHIGS